MKKIYLLTIFMLIAFSAEAKVLYVDHATGNDATTYEGNSVSNPWATIGRAAWGSTNRSNPNTSEAARAGDTVIVRAGTYSTTQGVGERYEPIYNPVNQGTYGNYIIFKAEGGVTLQSNTDGMGEPIIGSYQRDYITWDGFYIDEANVHTKRDTGPIVVWGADHVTIQNIEIKGANKSWSDNHNGIRLEWASNVNINNCKIYDISGNWGDNETAVMTYDSHDIIIEHNEFFNCGTGIFIKGMHDAEKDSQYNITIRYNLIYSHINGLYAYGVHGSYRAYQNIIRDCTNGIKFTGATDPAPLDVGIVNNTIDNCTNRGIYPNGCQESGAFVGTFIHNNIITSTSSAINTGWGCAISDLSDTSKFDFEHNLYYGNSSFSNLSGCSTLSGWKSTTSQDSESPASISLDPLYIDGPGNNFRLRESSPALNRGIDILDLNSNGSTTDAIAIGAYITGDEEIGMNLTSRPQAPRNLEVFPN